MKLPYSRELGGFQDFKNYIFFLISNQNFFGKYDLNLF